MSLRTQLEAYPQQTRLLVFTTLGHVYAGTLTNIEEDAVILAGADGVTRIVLNLNDVSGLRLHVEEPEGGA
jgi:hypothetical protein